MISPVCESLQFICQPVNTHHGSCVSGALDLSLSFVCLHLTAHYSGDFIAPPQHFLQALNEVQLRGRPPLCFNGVKGIVQPKITILSSFSHHHRKRIFREMSVWFGI